MPAKYARLITVAGAINSTEYDDGIESTEAELKTVTEIMINLDDIQGNIIEVWVESEKVAEYYDYSFDSEDDSGGTNTLKSVNKLHSIPIEYELELGEKMQVALNCGGTATNLRGSYVYELRT